MKYYIFIFIILMLSNVTHSQNGSGLRYKYSMPPNLDGIVSKQFALADGTTIYLVKSKSWGTEAGNENTYNLIKTGINGEVLWGKLLKNNDYNCGIRDAVLLQNESVLITGTLIHKLNINDYSEKIFISEIDKYGQLVWEKTYQLNKAINNTNEINYPLLTVSGDGNFYISFIIRKENYITGTKQNFPAIAKFTSNGNVIWNKYFFKNNNRRTNCYSRNAVEVKGNLIGNFDLQDYNSDGTNGETYSLAIQADTSSGFSLKCNKFEFTGLTWQNTWIINDGNSFTSGNQLKNIVDVVSVTNSNNSPSFANDLQAISYDIDSNLNLIRTKGIYYKYLSLKKVSPENTYYSKYFGFSKKGEALLGFRNFNYSNYVSNISDTLRYYFTKLSNEYSPVWQKKFVIASQGNVNQEAPSIIETNECNIQIALTHIGKHNSNNLKRSFEIINLNPFVKYKNSCFGEDTSFLEVKDIKIEQNSFSWDQQFTNILLPFNTSFFLEDIPVTKTELCSFINDCSKLKLTAPDTVCTKNDFLIHVNKESNCYFPIQWQVPIEIADTVQINDTTISISFKQPWHGKIYAFTETCNPIKDSLEIWVFKKVGKADLGKDSMLCNSQPIKLQLKETYKYYKWSTGSVDSFINVMNPGQYSVIATDFCNNIFVDTILIIPQNFAILISKDTTICKGDEINLMASEGFMNYQWTPSIGLNNSFSQTVVASPAYTTKYLLKVIRFPGCEVTASVEVKVDTCFKTIFVPNSFTPNNDNLNDVFKPIIEGRFHFYRLTIYNRYGQLIYQSNNPKTGWDGRFKGVLQPFGLYSWSMSYEFKNQTPQFKKGNVLLIR